MKNVGFALQEYFKKQKMTQQQVADRIGVSQSFVGRAFRGEYDFGKKTARRWADEFGFSYSFLLSGEGDLFDNDESLIMHDAINDLDSTPASEVEEPVSASGRASADYWKNLYEEKVRELERVKGKVDGLQMALDALRGVSVPSAAEPLKKSV